MRAVGTLCFKGQPQDAFLHPRGTRSTKHFYFPGLPGTGRPATLDETSFTFCTVCIMRPARTFDRTSAVISAFNFMFSLFSLPRSYSWPDSIWPVTHPSRSWQIDVHTEPGSAGGFFLLQWSFPLHCRYMHAQYD
ncbi:hypothetical protein XENOCAPTIV_011076 [Xenoophorus captivus]|uniref:Uncharacterized protein n=1 Tax=Xenoophorus captivus TaxID=1517983 RepID=A0ABV0SEP4_9TELE